MQVQTNEVNGVPVMARPVDATASVEWISPADAAKYLKKNLKNRRMKEGKVRTYVADMSAGRWLLNGETIKFSLGGLLLDGQNRLLAIVRSQVGVWSVVVRGLPDVTQITMDTGALRNLDDVLRMRGELNTAELATIVRAVACYIRYGVPISNGHASAPSQQELLDVLEKHPDLRDATSFGSGCRLDGLSRSNVGTLYWLFSRVDADDAERFFRLLQHGEGLFKGDPAHTLRERLLKDSKRHEKLSTQAKLAFAIKAWNEWRMGGRLSLLRWNSSESFPEITGFPDDIVAK